MKKGNTLVMFVLMVSVSLILVGCGDPSSTSSTPTATSKVVSQNADGSVQVLEYSSDPIGYNGEHGSRGRKDDSLTVKITVDKNGLITAVSNTHEAGSPKSRQYQSRFESAIASEIVGKNISNAKVSIVAGASNTSDAFNTALDQMRTKITQS